MPEGLRSVSALFSWVFASAVPGVALPTLKTGSGESRSWVRIPPHPFGFRRDLRGGCRPDGGRRGPEGTRPGTGGYAAPITSCHFGSDGLQSVITLARVITRALATPVRRGRRHG